MERFRHKSAKYAFKLVKNGSHPTVTCFSKANESQPSVIVRRVTRQLLKGLIMELKLKTIWMMRLKLLADGNKLRAEGNKLWAEGDKLLADGYKLRADGYKLWAEGDKLRAEGNKLRAEGDKLWAEGIIEFYGNIKIEWKSKSGVNGCELENGEFYGEDMDV